jgi:hypothetical protein
MTITDLSQALGMNLGSLSALISGRRRSAKAETRIAAYFGKERFELFPRRDGDDLKLLAEQEHGRGGGKGAA